MKTTAIFAELLIVGLQAFAWISFFVLAYIGLEFKLIDELKYIADWAALVTMLILSVAYVLGIIMDRLADSLLLRFTKAWGKKHKVEGNPDFTYMRLFVRSKSEGITDFLDYIRSRLRLSRSTALNFPLILLAYIMWQYQVVTDASFPFVLVLAGIVLECLIVYTWCRIQQTYDQRLTEAYGVLSEPDN